MRKTERFGLAGAGALALACVFGPMSVQLHADYGSTVIDQSPLFYWRFNDNSTSPASEVDNSATTDNAASAGADVVVNVTDDPALTPAGGFLGFESSNAWLNFQGQEASSFVAGLTSPLESMSSTVGSASMWFNTITGADPTSTESDPGSLYHGDSGADGALDVAFQPDDTLQLRIINNQDGTVVDLRSSQTYTDGQWHHVAAVWDRPGDFAALYIDGGAEAGGETISGSYSLIDGADFLFDNRHRFGKGLFNRHRYHGLGDELAIWDTALTAEQVRAQYEAGVIPEPATIGLMAVGAVAAMRRRRGLWVDSISIKR